MPRYQRWIAQRNWESSTSTNSAKLPICSLKNLPNPGSPDSHPVSNIFLRKWLNFCRIPSKVNCIDFIQNQKNHLRNKLHTNKFLISLHTKIKDKYSYTFWRKCQLLKPRSSIAFDMIHFIMTSTLNFWRKFWPNFSWHFKQ